MVQYWDKWWRGSHTSLQPMKSMGIASAGSKKSGRSGGSGRESAGASRAGAFLVMAHRSHSMHLPTPCQPQSHFFPFCGRPWSARGWFAHGTALGASTHFLPASSHIFPDGALPRGLPVDGLVTPATFGGIFTPAQLVFTFDLNLAPHFGQLLSWMVHMASHLSHFFCGIGMMSLGACGAPVRAIWVSPTMLCEFVL